MPKDISNQDSKHEPQETKKALEQSVPEQDSSKNETKQASPGQFKASQKAEEESLPKKTKPKKALKGKIKSRSRRKVKHRAKFFSLKRKAEKKTNRGRIPVGKKPDIKTAARIVNAAHKALPLDKIQGHTEDNPKDTAKRLVGEAKSFLGEEHKSAEAEESPEQYAIEQMEGKAKKASNIALSETKRAVEKSLTREKVPMSDEGPSLQSKEEESPEAYNEGLQKEVDKETDSHVMKEQGLKTHGEVPSEAESLYPTEVQPTPFAQPSAIPVPHSAGGTVHILEEHFIPASSHDIAPASPSLHTLDQEKRVAKDGIAAPSSPDNLQSGLLQRSQDVQTVESASLSVLYPEPERSAYQYYPEIQRRNESGPPIGKEVESEADKKVSPRPEKRPVLDKKEAADHTFSPGNQSAVTDQARFVQQFQPQSPGAAQFISRDDRSYITPFTSKPCPEPKSTSGRDFPGHGRGSRSASHSATSYREETKAEIKTREVSNEIHVSGKVKLNTWQRNFMVNQINNQTPALASATAQGGAAVQAVANYGQAAMFQAGGGMAAAATGAATGGIGFAVQAGKMAAERIAEQIKSAVQSAAATFRESKQTWGTLAALFFIPLLIALGALGVFRMGGSATNVGLSAEVLALMPQINAACEEHGIPEYAPLVAAVIMQESGGNAELVNGDVMMCAEGMGYPVGTPVSVEESIDFGTGLLADLLHQAGASGPADISKISLALQSYNFGGGYLTWAVSKYGGYSKENALEYSQQQAAAMGWSGYGDPEYVGHVLRYYQVTSGAMGDRSAIANGLFAYPMPGHTWFTYAGHEGIDISYSGIEGQPIYACAAGTVSYVQNNWSSSMGTSGMASYGNCVFINHGNGWESRYAHMTTAVVAPGAFVQEGQLLGYVGSTGNSTGPHLHLALYYNSSPSSGGVIYAEQAWPWLKE